MKIKTMIVSALLMIPFLGGAENAVQVDNEVLSKETVMLLAKKTFQGLNGSYKGYVGEDAWTVLVEDIIFDYQLWTMLILEWNKRNLKIESDIDFIREFNKKSIYRFSKGTTYYDFALRGEFILLMLAKKMRLYQGGLITWEFKRQMYNNFKKKYFIKLADYKSWKITESKKYDFFNTEYNAIERELKPNDSWWKKTFYYLHHYTIRYYVILMRKYVSWVDSYLLEWGVGKTEKKVKDMRILGIVVIPYVTFVILFFIIRKVFDIGCPKKMPFCWSIGLYLISLLLFYFGMSPFMTLVAIVVLITLFVGSWLTMYNRKLLDHGPLPLSVPDYGYAYELSGALTKIKAHDRVYHISPPSTWEDRYEIVKNGTYTTYYESPLGSDDKD